ncbi:hypothetical protein KUV50_02260 [Membranicola marinus]|uniref:Uncharacterized protein n=1 Tax=Membranihabitans marinus TaxID=1227546 RepID=A0A953HUW1_9BACT|nr:hypothetical protein [Membranihabitans marinus]MBY5956941.1 hypothetical protein [Membranihabitans marinus]
MIKLHATAEEKEQIDTRRQFLKLGMGAFTPVLLSGIFSTKQNSLSEKSSNKLKYQCLDYGRSFICNTAAFNSVRMWIESRTIVVDEQSGKEVVYYQGGSCKSENTFGEKDLFYEDNYDFLPIFGDGKVLVFRRHSNVRKDKNYRSIKKMVDMWGADPNIVLPKPKSITELKTWKDIEKATAAGTPIVTQTEIWNEETGLRAIIECPCKTMNISHPKKMYQIDTGPVALPDLSQRYPEMMEGLRLAYLAFNTDSFTDFVVEVPTPIQNEFKNGAHVYHYSEHISVTAKNKLFVVL